MRTKTLFLILAVCISILFTSCSYLNLGENDDSKDNEYNFLDSEDDVIDIGPVRGGVLKLYSTNPDTLNPILTNNKYVRDYSAFVFESLVTLDRSQKAVPTLAKSWEVSDDGLT